MENRPLIVSACSHHPSSCASLNFFRSDSSRRRIVCLSRSRICSARSTSFMSWSMSGTVATIRVRREGTVERTATPECTNAAAGCTMSAAATRMECRAMFSALIAPSCPEGSTWFCCQAVQADPLDELRSVEVGPDARARIKRDSHSRCPPTLFESHDGRAAGPRVRAVAALGRARVRPPPSYPQDPRAPAHFGPGRGCGGRARHARRASARRGRGCARGQARARGGEGGDRGDESSRAGSARSSQARAGHAGTAAGASPRRCSHQRGACCGGSYARGRWHGTPTSGHGGCQQRGSRGGSSSNCTYST
mmetsp:Transcript_1265/g.3536  ORF Transcript_1265/g.3536 Transcript_1265/m.3536 type:complete len:308 (+) Transcript_1265:576-1499(+)